MIMGVIASRSSNTIINNISPKALDYFQIQKDSLTRYISPHYNEIIPKIQLSIPDLHFNYDSILKKQEKLKTGGTLITRKIFSFLISNGDSTKNLMEVKSTLYFELFKGKRIASITFKQLDVFGPTFEDTTLIAKSWMSQLANRMHLKTTERKLRKQLLFSIGQYVDPEVMADNEKIYRDLPYIRDIAIVINPKSNEADEVDVLILIKERFEYGFIIDADPPETKLQVYDDNMFGLGHRFMAKVIHHQFEHPDWGGEVSYSFSDLGAKFVNGGLGFVETYKKKGWNIFVEKKFISSEILNAGGLSIQRAYKDNYVTPYTLTRLDSSISYLYTDSWLGHTFQNKNMNSKIGDVVLSGRFFHQNYFSEYGLSDFGFIRNHDFLLSTIGFSKRSLFKNNLVYGYGITEDIPYGRYFELASGIDFSRHGNRLYCHVLYTKAGIFQGGSYISSTMGLGGYFRNSIFEQGTFKLNLNYFSRLIFINKSPYRNFINIELLNGINRYPDEYISINRYYGLRDFRSLDVTGTSRLKINLESVRFLNWNYHGFHFAHYFFGDCAFISNNIRNLLKDDFFTGLGMGLRVHNESLVFRVFELRLTWFPVVPNDQNILKFKIFTQSKTTFDDFLGRKPEEISFR